MPLFHLHQLKRFTRIRRVHKRHQDGTQLLEIDRLRHVRVEARVNTLLVDIAQDVGG